MSLPPGTQVQDLLKWLSEDPERMDEFLGRLDFAMQLEWDCGLGQAMELFGPEEFAIAAKYA